MIHYSATVSQSSDVSAPSRTIVQAPNNNYVEFDILVNSEACLSPKISKLALSVFMKVIDIFLSYKIDTSFASFGFGISELWLDICSMFKLKFSNIEIEPQSLLSLKSPQVSFLHVKNNIYKDPKLLELIKTQSRKKTCLCKNWQKRQIGSKL